MTGDAASVRSGEIGKGERKAGDGLHGQGRCEKRFWRCGAEAAYLGTIIWSSEIRVYGECLGVKRRRRPW